MTTTTRELIDASEVGKMLGGLTTAEVRRLVARGRLPQPVVKLTRKISRWAREDIAALVGRPAA